MINIFLDPSYYFNFIFFILAVFLAFYVPGSVLLKRFKFDFLTNFVFSLTVGITLWGFQGFIFGNFGFRNLSYVYLLFFLIFWVKINLIDKPKIPKLNFTKKDLPVIIILIIGVLVQLLFTFLNGIKIDQGLYFCCGLPDSLYHIGLTDSLVKNFPPYEPAMTGVIVYNYHYLSNLVDADLVRVFHLPLIVTVYQHMVLLISVLIGLSAIVFAKVLKLGRVFTCFLLLFIFFAGDATYILSFLAGMGLNFSTPFLYDATNLWFSPPRAFAVFITLSGLGMFCIWIKNKSNYLGVLLAVIFASLVGFKIYNGFAVFFGLFFVFLYFLIRKDYKKLFLPILTILIALFIYLPVNKGASGLYYVGFWRVENFVSQLNIGLSHMELARQIYVTHHNIPRIIEYELIYIFLYFIFVFGALNIAWIQNKKSLKLFPEELNILLISSLVISLFLGFFYFQKISGPNTSQFLIAAEMLASLYAALSCMVIYKKLGKYGIILIILVFLITIPRVINSSSAKYFEIISRKNLIISNQELDALNYLKNNSPKSSVILTDNEKLKIEKTCYYVSFLSERSLFLCDANGILKDHGVKVDQRSQDLKKIVKNFNSEVSTRLLLSNKIDYVYTSSDKSVFASDSKVLKTVFLNDKIRIIKINRWP